MNKGIILFGIVALLFGLSFGIRIDNPYNLENYPVVSLFAAVTTVNTEEITVPWGIFVIFGIWLIYEGLLDRGQSDGEGK